MKIVMVIDRNGQFSNGHTQTAIPKRALPIVLYNQSRNVQMCKNYMNVILEMSTC
uniref:Uncharacterized protein n=1 Tax=Meloidogyne incognita TaxID=6306 RepID=A0A914LLH8_MELIC